MKIVFTWICLYLAVRFSPRTRSIHISGETSMCFARSLAYFYMNYGYKPVENRQCYRPWAFQPFCRSAPALSCLNSYTAKRLFAQ